MHFKSVAVLFSLLLPIAVHSAPIGVPNSSILYPRAIAVDVQPDPSGDFKILLHKPAEPDALPPGCSKAEKKDKKKQDAKCKSWNTSHDAYVKNVVPRITAAIHAAEQQLHLVGPLRVLVKSEFHLHADHDDLGHWTFSFSAPACGAGPCVGHAYKAGEVRQARIFSSAHATIFDA